VHFVDVIIQFLILITTYLLVCSVQIQILSSRPRKNSLSYPTDDDEDIEEEADEVVPDGVEEVELARISIEQRERERKLVLDDIRTLSFTNDIPGESTCPENDGELWMITGGKSTLVGFSLPIIGI